MSARALVLAGLLVLAGCGGVPEDGTPQTTLTPAEVADPTLAPGVTERGLVDLSKLVSAHRGAYADGVERTSRHRQAWVNGTTLRDARRRVVSNGSCRYYLFEETVAVGQRAPQEFSLYANGTHVLEHRVHPAGNSTRLMDGLSGEPRSPCSVGVLTPNGDERLYAVLGRAEFDVASAGDRVRLTASNVDLPPIVSGTVAAGNVTGDVEVVLTSDGAVRRLRVGYEGETADGRVRGVIVDRFRPSDGPEPPSWVANAAADDSDETAGGANASTETAPATR